MSKIEEEKETKTRLCHYMYTIHLTKTQGIKT